MARCRDAGGGRLRRHPFSHVSVGVGVLATAETGALGVYSYPGIGKGPGRKDVGDAASFSGLSK